MQHLILPKSHINISPVQRLTQRREAVLCLSGTQQLVRVIHSRIKLCSQDTTVKTLPSNLQKQVLFHSSCSWRFAAYQMRSLGEQRLCLARTSALGCSQGPSFAGQFFLFCSIIRENFKISALLICLNYQKWIRLYKATKRTGHQLQIHRQ